MTTNINGIDIEALQAAEQSDAAAVAVLNQRIAALEAHPDVDNADVDALKAQIESLKAQVVGNATDEAQDKADIAALAVQMAALHPVSAEDIVQQLIAAIAKGITVTVGGSTGGSTGGNSNSGPPTYVPPETPDTQEFPLKPVLDAAGNLRAGTGPDTFEIIAGNNPTDKTVSEFSIAMNLHTSSEKMLATGYRISDMGGEGAKQAFSISGHFGDNPKFYVVGSGEGLKDITVTRITYRGLPYYSFSSGVNSRDPSATDFDGTKVYNSAWGQLLTFGPYQEPAYVPPPPPPTEQTVVVGAKINGAVHADAKMADLIDATAAGGTLELPAGIIFGTSAVPRAMTIKGAGKDATYIDGTGLRPTYDKGGLVPLVPGVVFQDMTIRNFSIPEAVGGNAAGIRDNDAGIGFKCARVRVKGNQNGVLTNTANYDFDDCDFEENGSGSGLTHNFYINGSPTSVLNMTNCRSSAPKGGHAGKTRAGTSNFKDCVFETGGDGAALDIPDGGAVSFDNMTLIHPGGATYNILTLGVESDKNAATGMTINTKNGLRIEDPTGVAQLYGARGAVLNLDDTCTYKGPQDQIKNIGFIINGTLKKVN